ncbi:hypothetical protein DFH11DRAFT_1723082 [Phellopilus nigrolimitatus]|nr:hypothetical protein DFH11DRAFT_1723082 [Phellopilus nigrolimitatus]
MGPMSRSKRLKKAQTQAKIWFFQLVLRFAQLMKLSMTHLEDLDSLVLNLLDLIAADDKPEKHKMIKDTLKVLAGTGVRPAALRAHISALHATLPLLVFPVPIPDSALPPPTAESDSDSDSESAPPPWTSTRISACELASAAAPSRRSDLEDMSVAITGSHEQDWTAEEVEMGLGTGHDEGNAKKSETKVKAGPPAKDTEKDKAHRAAREAHKDRLSVLEHAHALALQAAIPRLGPLWRDARANVYYYVVSTNRRTKKQTRSPDAEERVGLRMWGWFLAV